MRLRFLPFAILGVVAASACSDPLNVQNTNNPDVDRVLSTPDGIEGLFRSSYQQVHSATHGSTTALFSALQVMSGESYATVANFGMALRSGVPRSIIDNTRGNQTASENTRDFSLLQRNARNIANGITALDNLIANGSSLGSASADKRARAWGHFTLGVALGKVALVYDQAAVPSPGMPTDSTPPLIPYNEVMDAAIANLDLALSTANAPEGGSISIPNDWFRTEGGDAMSQAEFIQLANSFKARFRAGVARTPAERDAVNWTQVAADAAAGIQDDVVLALSSTAGWTMPWLSQALVNSTWSMVPPMYIGMADTSGNFRKWILPPIGDLSAAPRLAGGDPGAFFMIHTPDDRFPAGNTRAQQDSNSPSIVAQGLTDVYFRNRTDADTEGQVWGQSPYDFMRFSGYRGGNSNGPWVLMSATEISMLRAEADMRLNPGSPTVAVTLINDSRTDHGLPPFAAGATRETRAPNHPGGGGFSCVPQTPTAGNRVVECGTLWEAMKYEKRIETMFTGYGQWFMDHRGWGDLVVGTPTMYPVPYQEMDARRAEFYNSKAEWNSAAGTYSY